ncbi:MAG: site-specific DNA-methyltransferase [Treponema sp.]|nr:site-specific DNA-methyltransferase [Treponema sp.]
MSDSITSHPKLELTWIGKGNLPKLEPRILLEDPSKSYHAAHHVSKKDIFDNKLIFGDNLLALKALESEYTGKVKCIYIDPPYNTGSAFEQYDDGVEHSVWLSLMRDRLELLRTLLSDDGSIWVSIDDNEMPYLKILCDEVFGRRNFIASIIWQKLFTVKNSAKYFSDMHEYILVVAKNIDSFHLNLLPRTQELDQSYTNVDNDPRGPWTTNAIQARNYYSQGSYKITSPDGTVFMPPAGTYWRISEDNFNKLNNDGRIWWGRDGTSVPRIKKFLSEAKQGVVPATLWFYSDVGTNAEAKMEVRALFETETNTPVFMTPKPERLIKRILELSTNSGDLVLDSFAGSGTTGAVAQKMGRRWIMVELGEHCHTHIIPRLKKVINGDDPGGITKSQNWKGGGGFRYYRLAPSLLKKDKWGNWVINTEYNPEMLAEAVCKLEGFTYEPSDSVYWMQGHSTESDFIYVTTQILEREQLQLLSEEVGAGRTLLVLCSAFRGITADQAMQAFPNLTIKKIPNAVLSKCEWDHDDYSLQIENLPDAPAPDQGELFDGEEE